MEDRLAKLALALGRACARREVAWMKRSRPENSSLCDMLDRRIAGEPLQYILGTTPFGPLDLLVRPPTLIPRPETEDWAIRLARTRTAFPVRLLDLCTGSGCIPLLLCHLWPPHSTRALGIDLSPHAVALAADNAARAHLQHAFTPRLADLRDPDLPRQLDPPFDVITANPPYIPLRDYHSLPPSVKDYEDRRALVGGDDGLAFYRAIAALVARDGVLAPHATIALEIGYDQARAVTRILRNTPGLPLASVEIWKDPWDKDRVLLARTP